MSAMITAPDSRAHAGFAATATGSDSPWAVLAFWVAVGTVWTWVSAVSVLLYRQATEADPSALAR